MNKNQSYLLACEIMYRNIRKDFDGLEVDTLAWGSVSPRSVWPCEPTLSGGTTLSTVARAFIQLEIPQRLMVLRVATPEVPEGQWVPVAWYREGFPYRFTIVDSALLAKSTKFLNE